MFRHQNCEFSLNIARIMVKTVTMQVMAAILAAILDFLESSRVIASHPLDSWSGPSYLSKNCNEMVSPKFWGYPGLATGLFMILNLLTSLRCLFSGLILNNALYWLPWISFISDFYSQPRNTYIFQLSRLVVIRRWACFRGLITCLLYGCPCLEIMFQTAFGL